MSFIPGGVVLPDPFQRMGTWRNSAETQRSGPEVKNGRSSAKDDTPERLRDAGHPEGGELYPAVEVRRHCKKNSSVLSCIGKRTKEGCDRGSEKSGQFTAEEMEKG